MTEYSDEPTAIQDDNASSRIEPTRTSYHHGNLRQALLDEAGRVLAADGLEAISLRGLARHLGVSHAAPSHHFADRGALLAELAADGFARLADRYDAALPAASDPWVTAGSIYVEEALANLQRYRLLFCPEIARLSDPPERLVDEMTRVFRHLRAIGRSVAVDDVDLEGFDPYDDAILCLEDPELVGWAMVHGAVSLYLDGFLGGDEASFQRTVLALVHQVRPRSAQMT